MRRPASVIAPWASMAPSACSRARAQAQAGAGGEFEPGQVVRVGQAPEGQLQDQTGEVRLQDLGRTLRRPASSLLLRPQPQAAARAEPTGTTGALLGGGPRDGLGHQADQTASRIVARLPGQAAVDHGADAVDGHRGLGDVGGQHDPPRRVRRWPQRAVLLGHRQRTVQRQHLRCRPCRRAPPARPCGGRSPRHPGRNTNRSPGCSARA